MMFLCLLCLAVVASALPTPESPQSVIFIGPNGVETTKNVVEFTFTPQEAGSEVKPENRLFTIPKAPLLPPLYLFTYEKLNPKSSEANEGGNNEDNEEGKKPEEGKDPEGRLLFVRLDFLTDVLTPLISYFVPDDLSNPPFFTTEDNENRLYMVIKP